MNNPLEQLVGQHVTMSGIVQDYAQVIFENAGLTIYNDYAVSENKNVAELKGLILASVSENDEEVVLKFEDGTAINVNLKSDAYHCPEAMVLHRDGQPTVVWN
jgi:hypothetical protein